MKARILYYNEQTGEGKVIDKEGVKHPFSADEWSDYSNFPKGGQFVVCEMDGERISSLTFDKEGERSKEEEQEEAPQEPVPKTPKQPKTSGSGPTLSIEECLENYFEPINFLIGAPPKVIRTDAYLDFFLIRRFMTTAYNDMQDIDPHIRLDNELKERYQKIQSLYLAYKNTKENTDRYGLAFELVFLRNQPEYLRFIRHKEECLTRLSAMRDLEESIYPDVRSKEQQLKNMKNASKEEREHIEGQLKKMKKMYVDAIHENANISEELGNMKDLKAHYTDLYYQDFIAAFEKEAGYYLKSIAKILGYKAYEFDQLLWNKARNSRPVQEYFKQSNITGEFSTLTFLRYYLNTLDKEKLNKEHKDLFKLQAYLESQEGCI